MATTSPLLKPARVRREDLPSDASGRCICGNPVHAHDAGKAGRPRTHCSKECREFAAAINVLGFWIDGVRTKATPAAWLSIRGRLFGFTAQRAWNRGVRRKRPA